MCKIVIDDSLFHSIILDGMTGVFVLDPDGNTVVTCHRDGNISTQGDTVECKEQWSEIVKYGDALSLGKYHTFKFCLNNPHYEYEFSNKPLQAVYT